MALRQSEAVDPAKVAAAERAADGIFRVWTSLNYPRPPVSSYSGYLTARGRQLAAAYDPVTDNPELDCRTGMPATMFDPGQMFLEQHGDRIIVRIYEYDIERTIHLNGTANPVRTSTSNLGYSVGHWEGATLVVTTTRLDSPYLDSYGTPLSAQVSLIMGWRDVIPIVKVGSGEESESSTCDLKCQTPTTTKTRSRQHWPASATIGS